MHKVIGAHNPASQHLYSVAQTREIEKSAAAALPPHTLMQRAGLAVAKLATALVPHARHIWIACGPGNNGGDGFEAALHLHQWGKKVTVSWTGTFGKPLPPDAQASYKRAVAAGIVIASQAPRDFDFCIDALLGIGGTLDTDREGSALMLQWLDAMWTSDKPRLAVDVPSGLDADTGRATYAASATKSIAAQAYEKSLAATFTLCLLTLKPGLFTSDGRDTAGEVWFDDLGESSSGAPTALLLGSKSAAIPSRTAAAHSSHKGTFGDVTVIGGESTAHSHMAGAALLAARAALHAGAGRVYVALLGESGVNVDLQQPELMFRSPDALDFKQQVIVCGCGGGDAVKSVLARVLSTAQRAVFDADALNAIATDTTLQTLLRARNGRSYQTVLTPHPLEAARLLGGNTAAIQASRLAAANQLAERFQCTVVLKGSGTVIAAPGQLPAINSSGNALLATAGTGDVLAGMTGAGLGSGLRAFDAACSAVFAHGQLADKWLAHKPGEALTASALALQRR